jgi:serine/threonine protein kinase
VSPVSPARITLPDRYQVVRHIAVGGMASVWEAHDELLGRSVAVKVLASHLSEDDRARRRFQREARAAAGLSSHPHVVTIYDVGEHAGRTFMVMELMRGGSLAARLPDVPRQDALRWLREAAGALDSAHEAGVVHRDVKPANLLLDHRDRLAIADFGIARLAFEDQLTATGQVLGTAAYIAPEQAMGEAATAASDRYALAVVAYELLTGRRPFEAEHFAAQARAHVEDDPRPASERKPELPRAVDGVLDRGMAKAPADRWRSATEMVEELDAALATGATGPTKPMAAAASSSRATTPPAITSGRGRRVALALAGLFGLLAAAVVAFVLISDGGDGDREGGRAGAETPQAERRQERREATPTSEPTQESTPTQTATPTATATPAPTATATPQPPPASGLAAARDLQVDGYNARQAGNYEQALQLSQQALEACGDRRPLDPCGYAVFEIGVALNRLGRPQEAIPYLQQRLEYGGSQEAEAELEDALSKVEGGEGQGKGNDNRGKGGGD